MRCSGIIPGHGDSPSRSPARSPRIERVADLASNPELSASPVSHVQEKSDAKSTAWSDFVVRVRKHLRKSAEKDQHPGSSGQISKIAPEVDDASHFSRELETFPDDKRDDHRSDPLDLSARSESDGAEGSDSWAESDSVFMSKEFIRRNFAVDTKLLGHKTSEPPEPASEPNLDTPMSQERSEVGHDDESDMEKTQNEVDRDEPENTLPSAPEIEDSLSPVKSTPEGGCDEERGSPLDLSKHAVGESLEAPDALAESPTESALEEYLLEDERSESQRHICALCEREFYEKAGLDKHVCANIDEKPFSCDFCGNSFSMKSSLKVHVSLHTGRKPRCCNICGKSFLYGSILKRHMARHTVEEPQGCPMCSESFASMPELEKHVLMHYEEKMQQCRVQENIPTQKSDIEMQSCISEEDARSSSPNVDAPIEGKGSEMHEFLPAAEEQLQCTINRVDDSERIAS